MVEFVSANPTGSDAHGQRARRRCWATAWPLCWTGAGNDRDPRVSTSTTRATRWISSPTRSRAATSRRCAARTPIEFDPSWYQGDDIKALAHDLVGQYGDSLLDKTPEERFAIIEGYGLPTNIARMERDLGRYKINYDVMVPRERAA